MAKSEKLNLSLSVVLPEMTAEARWGFIQWVQGDFKSYVERIGDVELNYTPNAFWHAVQKFDVKVTGTAKPKPEPEIPVEIEEQPEEDQSPEPEPEPAPKPTRSTRGRSKK